jgi:hypothetical protein
MHPSLERRYILLRQAVVAGEMTNGELEQWGSMRKWRNNATRELWRALRDLISQLNGG